MSKQTRKQEPMRFLVFSASLRTDSLNTKLAKMAASVLEENNGIVDFAGMHDFDCPSFNHDTELKGEVPMGAKEFKKRLEASNALVICSPEYNGSMPGHLKNVIDWVSRFRPQPFNERHALLMSASPSMAGGNRGLWSLRIPFEHLGTSVFPNMFSLAMAHKAFGEDGSLVDATLAKRFHDNIVAFMDLAEAATHYACMKRSWVEFLGETIEAATDRVE